jgi:glycosyltransferase involved in cell wall biosynthesis
MIQEASPQMAAQAGVEGARPRATVSVVIPCRNCEAWIGRTIKSVLDGDHPAAIIVIDDGSTDGSLSVISSFGENVHWETGPNRGAPAARNRGHSLASTEYVMFLDADDYVEGELIPGMAEAAELALADIVFGPYVYEFEDQSRREGWRIGSSIEDAEALMCAWLRGDYVPPCAVLWRTGFLHRIGGWRESLSSNQDGELVLRALSNGARWTVSAKGRGVYYQHGSPNRVGSNMSLPAFEARMQVLELLPGEGQSLHVKEAFSRAYYDLARGAYRKGHSKLGDKAIKMSAVDGSFRHHGTLLHRIGASLLGLERKERLATLLMSGARLK